MRGLRSGAGFVAALAALAALALTGCGGIQKLELPKDYRPPPPLPPELAARFAYEKEAIDPKIDRLGEDTDFEHFQGVYEAPCPVTHERRRVVFEMYRSKHGEGRRPVVTLVPILAGRYPECEYLGRLFARNGIHAFFVHREDDLLAFRNEPADLETILRRSIVNIRRTLDWVAARPDVDPGRIGLCGISLGAIGGSIALAVEPRFRRNVLIMGGADLARIFWESHETPVKFWRVDHERRWNVETLEAFRERFTKDFISDPALYAPYVDARNVLQFVARLDNKVPTPCQWKLWEALGKPSGYSIGIGHYTAILYLGFAEEQALAFYREGFGLRAPEGEAVARR